MNEHHKSIIMAEKTPVRMVVDFQNCLTISSDEGQCADSGWIEGRIGE